MKSALHLAALSALIGGVVSFSQSHDSICLFRLPSREAPPKALFGQQEEGKHSVAELGIPPKAKPGTDDPNIESTNQNEDVGKSGWLETSTRNTLDVSQHPIGSLTPMDLAMIYELMVTWSKRSSVEGAVNAEKLLKRIIDDINAGNTNISVDSGIYLVIMEAWISNKTEGSAARAQNILDAVVAKYKVTGDINLIPIRKMYNLLIRAWAKEPNGIEKSKAVLGELIRFWKDENEERLCPIASSFTPLMEYYANAENGLEKTENIFNMMTQLNVTKSPRIYSLLQTAHVRSGLPDAPSIVLRIFNEMQALAEDGHHWAIPTQSNYHAYFHALMNQRSIRSVAKARSFFQKMEAPKEKGGYGEEASTLIFASLLEIGRRCPNANVGAQMAMEVLSILEERIISGTGHPSLSIYTWHYNVVLDVLAQSDRPKVIDEIDSMMERMKNMGNNIKPDCQTYRAKLDAMRRKCGRNNALRFAAEAEEVVKRMIETSQDSKPFSRPDASIFTALLRMYQKSTQSEAGFKAEKVVRSMEKMYDEGTLSFPPDVIHYTILSSIWAKGLVDDSVARCAEIIEHMVERDKAGYPKTRPNYRTYSSLMTALSRKLCADKAEQLLSHVMKLYEDGYLKEQPDEVLFATVINTHLKSKVRDQGIRAEGVLERFLEFCQEDGSQMRPSIRSFTPIIMFYTRSPKPDAPYRAEYCLNQLLELFMETRSPELTPTKATFVMVLESCTGKKSIDVGERAERLLNHMRVLNQNYGVKGLEADTTVLDLVIRAWADSGHGESGVHAEMHLDRMEREYREGNEKMQPSTASYVQTIAAWSRSKIECKAERAWMVLQRMKKEETVNENVVSDSLAASLVINACAFSTPQERTDAFKLGVRVFDEIMESMVPTTYTFVWFFQMCGRIKSDDKEHQIQRAFEHCKDRGLVNTKVLSRLQSASPNSLFKELMMSASIDYETTYSLSTLMSKIPQAWKANA